MATFGVVLYHSWLITGANRLDGGVLRAVVSLGWVGIDVFFVLSGFVHFLPIASRGGGGVGPWRKYALRRASRIVPAYYAALIVVIWLTRTIDWFGLLGHLVFLQVPLFGLSTRTGLHADQPLWTLSIEATFYVVLPLVAARYVRHPGWWLLGALVVSEGWKLATRTHGVHWAMQFPSYASHFALGMTAACVYARRDQFERLVRWAPVAQAMSFLAFIFFASRFVDTEAVHRFIDNLPMAIAFTAFVLFTAMRPRSLRPGPLRFASNVSYGVYLFHILVIGRLLRFVAPNGSSGAFVKVAALTSAISLVIGWLSLRFVETPVRNWAKGR